MALRHDDSTINIVVVIIIIILIIIITTPFKKGIQTLQVISKKSHFEALVLTTKNNKEEIQKKTKITNPNTNKLTIIKTQNKKLNLKR